jgi:hypothetical protein
MGPSGQNVDVAQRAMSVFMIDKEREFIPADVIEEMAEEGITKE